MTRRVWVVERQRNSRQPWHVVSMTTHVLVAAGDLAGFEAETRQLPRRDRWSRARYRVVEYVPREEVTT
jgi:hypothetical protein